MPGERVLIFFLLQLLAFAYAVVRGGGPERAVGSALLAAALLTAVVQRSFADRFVHVDLGILLVDAALLCILLLVALTADRFWTMWVAALHMLGTGAHLVRLVDVGIMHSSVYAAMLASWSYPIVALLAIGTWRHVARTRACGSDRDWS